VSTILASNFVINLTSTSAVLHSDDAAITFPNLDAGSQGVKVVETAVLYVDMRSSTQLSLRYHPETVTRLYSAFVRAMTRCAKVFNGKVRGIIGDRVMILFESADCYANAVYTAILINSVCQHVINKHFPHEDLRFGIGIDYGRMLVTKTGIRRHGFEQQSYRSLVWLGRPANVASKLTDNANKPEEARELVKRRVGYDYCHDGTPPLCQDEWPHDFVQKFTYDRARGTMVAPNFHSFTVVKERIVINPATPPILMSKRVKDGFKATCPFAPEIQNGWFTKVNRSIPDVPDEGFDGDVTYTALPHRGLQISHL
jgi:class 3 adenylate cyclase